MSNDAQKITTVLLMLLSSLEEESSILRVQGWIKEQAEAGEASEKLPAKQERQMLLDIRRQSMGIVRRIEKVL